MARSALHITAAALAALAVALGCTACADGGGAGSSQSVEADPPEPPTIDGKARDVTPAVYARTRLRRANIAFNAPETVQLNETKDIELLLSDDRSVAELKRRLEEHGRRIGAEIRIADVMEATLTGGAFKIEEITPSQQAIGRGVTRWKWEIEPTETGTRRLHLTVTALVAVDGKDRRQAIRTFERTLEVESVAIGMPAKVAGFFTDNWQWIVTTLLIPLFAYVVRRRQRTEGSPSGATSA